MSGKLSTKNIQAGGSTPKVIQEALGKEAAEDAKKQIEDAGGKVSLT